MSQTIVLVPPRPTWSEEEDAALRAAVADRLSASEAASLLSKKFGREFSRNAAIGRAARLGLSFQSPSKHNTASIALVPGCGKKRVKPAPEQKPKIERHHGLSATRLLPVEPFPDDDIAIPGSGRVSILELNESTCKWPIGDPAKEGFGFCGSRKHGDGKPYCSFHARIAYVASQERRRSRDQVSAVQSKKSGQFAALSRAR